MIIKNMKGEVNLICDMCNTSILYDSLEDLQEDLMFNDWSYKQERRLNGKTEHYCPTCSTDVVLY